MRQSNNLIKLILIDSIIIYITDHLYWPNMTRNGMIYDLSLLILLTELKIFLVWYFMVKGIAFTGEWDAASSASPDPRPALDDMHGCLMTYLGPLNLTVTAIVVKYKWMRYHLQIPFPFQLAFLFQPTSRLLQSHYPHKHHLSGYWE